MPHPSNPVDDIRVASSYREHLLVRELEDVWLVLSVSLIRSFAEDLPASAASV